MNLETVFTNDDITEIYNEMILYSILKYQSLPTTWQEEFKSRYEIALKHMQERNLTAKMLQNKSMEEIKTELTNYQNIYNYIIKQNREVVDQIGAQIEKVVLETIGKKTEELDRISFLFDFITNYITYSEDYFHYCLEIPTVDGFTFDFKNNIPVDASKNGLLVIGQGICENISWLIEELGKKLNLNISTINCKYKDSLHALNMIRMQDGNDYLLDATRLIRKDKKKEECFLVSAKTLNKENNYQFKENMPVATDYSKPIPSTQEETEKLIESINQIRPQIEDLNNKTSRSLR